MRMISSTCSGLFAAMFLLAAIQAAPAQDTATAMSRRPAALDKPRLAQAPEPLCFCWSDGKKVAEGATACIRTTLGRRLAACGRVINMMSWEVSESPCPES